MAAPAAAPAAAEPEVPTSDRGPSAAAAEEARQLEDAREKGLALVAEQARVEEQLLRDHARRQAAATGGDGAGGAPAADADQSFSTITADPSAVLPASPGQGAPGAPSSPASPSSPGKPAAEEVEDEDLPPPWFAYRTPEGNTYYYNAETTETAWRIPGYHESDDDEDGAES